MSVIFKNPNDGKRSWLGIGIGFISAGALFVIIPLTQLMTMEPPEKIEIEEAQAFIQPPEPPPEEPEPPEPEVEEEEPPELDEPPPQLTLEQLDLALNPGTGGDLGGDFSLPTFEASQASLGTDDVFDLSELDSQPGPTSRVPPKFPRKLRAKGVSGKAVILFVVDRAGNVINAKVEEATHPEFGEAALEAIKQWKFTPGVKDGNKVKTRVRLPVPFKSK